MSDPKLDFAEGDTLWFVDFADSGNRDLTESDISVGYVFSGVVAEIAEMERKRREDGWDAMFRVGFTDSTQPMYFNVGRGASQNPRWFATRDEALATVNRSHTNTVADLEDQLARTQEALDIAREQASQPIIETVTAVALGYGFRLQTLKEAIAEWERRDRFVTTSLKGLTLIRPDGEQIDLGAENPDE